MSFRIPQKPSDQREPENGASVLDVELLAERAAALGRGGRDVEDALRRLRDYDAAGGGPERATLLATAANAVWGFLIHRELTGLRDRDQVIRDYCIPREVLARLGAR